MSKNGKAINKVQKESEFSLLHWGTLIGLCLFIFIFPFSAGLFNGYDFGFEANLYEAIMYTSVLLLIAAVYLVWQWRADDVKGWLAVAILGIPLIYFISSFNAVSTYSAEMMVLITLLLAAFYIVGLYVTKDRLASAVVSHAIQAAAYIVITYGLLNLFGQVYYPDAMWLADNGYRLASVFQYSNAYAAFLTAALLGAAYFLTHTRKWYVQSIHAFMLVPIIVSFMLTYSRGGIVVLPVILALTLPFLGFVRQIWFLLHLIVAGVSSLAILGEITKRTEQIALIVQPQPDVKPATTISMFDTLPLQGWALIVVASLISAAVSVLLQRKLSERLSRRTQSVQLRKGSSLFVTGAMLGVGALLIILLFAGNIFQSILPASIGDRLANINFQQHSVLERKTFYLDALKVSKDYPLMGAGGGAWTSIYEEYQNNPYVSRQAHSFLMQTLVEVGWVGLLVMLLIFAVTFRLFIKMQRDPLHKGKQIFFYIVAISLLIHSLIDFDMSYIYLAAIVFLSLGALVAPYEQKIGVPLFLKEKQNVWRFVYPGLLLALSITLLVISYREYRAVHSYNQAAYLAQQKSNLNEIMPHLEKAIELSPTNPAYLITKMDWMWQAYLASGNTQYREELKNTLSKAQLYDPYNRIILLTKYRYLKNVGDTSGVLQTLEEGLKKFQWDIKFYETAIMEYYMMGSAEKAADEASAQAKWQRALNLYAEVLNRQDRLKTLPEEQLQGRAFNVTPMMGQAVGQIYFYNNDYPSALKVLELNLAGDLAKDQYLRANIRYYLASLKATGGWNEDLYNQLVSASPEEQELLQQLTAEFSK